MFGIKIIGQIQTLYLKSDMVMIGDKEIQCFHNHQRFEIKKENEIWNYPMVGEIYELWINSEQVIGGTK